MNREKIKRNEAGITLIEIIMASFVFSLIIVMVSGIFITNFRIQRKTYAVQTTLAETSYAIEYMSRLMRMARRDSNGNCIVSGYTYNYYVEDGKKGVRFLDYKGRCVTFFYNPDDDAIKVLMENSENGDIIINNLPLTSSLILVSDFGIYINVSPPEEGEDLLLHVNQPSVTISFNAKERIQTIKPFSMRIQTTVTRRGLDVR